MTGQVVRFSVYNPRTKRPDQKTISFGGRTKRTEEEARRMGDEWREQKKREYAAAPTLPPPSVPAATPVATPVAAPVAAPSIARKPLALTLSPKTGNTVVVVGSSKSGKTTLIIDLIREYFSDYLGVLFCVNAHAPIYRGLPSAYLRAPDFIPQVVKAQYKVNKISKNRYPFLCYLDDMVDERVKNSDQVRRLFTVYRNSNISTVMAVQDCRLLTKTNRGNLNNVIFLKLNSDELIENVVKCFLSSHLHGKTLMEKIEAYKALTAGHGHGILLNALDNEFSVF